MGGKRKRKVQALEFSDDDGNGASATHSRHVSIAVPRRRTKPKMRVSKIALSEVDQALFAHTLPPPSSDDAMSSAIPEDAPTQEDFQGSQDFQPEAEVILVPDLTDTQGGRRSRKKRKRRIHHLQEFAKARDTILDELLRHEGLGDQVYPAQCAICDERPADMKCIDCTSSQLSCATCMCERHARDPLHRTQRWNGICFEAYTLLEAGLEIQLGHDGLPCPHPHDTSNNLVILDITGLHTVCVRFCECGRIGSHMLYVQFLRASWWPATLDRPQTAITIRALKLFHALTLQGKMNAYDFYHGLVRITEGSSLKMPKSRYQEFSRAARCFRHVRMTKRSGRGHDPGGIAGTPLGALGLDCPACPHPGVNLPDGWENTPPHLRFIYTLFLAVDANFKLKLKNHGYKDIELAPGWAYFVSNSLYKSHLAIHATESEIQTCNSSFTAIDHANSAGQRRFAINGVGAVICGRHSFFRTNGVGDLERGERYANMDFILLMTMMLAMEIFMLIVISYDIACQYSKNFRARMGHFPPAFQLDTTKTKITFLVPKFHLPAHGPSCQVKYSFNFTEGVGRTYGEGIEANWSETNGAALSTREMSSGARHEALDDFFGAMNWRKTTTMGTQLAHMLKDAVCEIAKQQAIFDEVKHTFPEDVIAQWDVAIAEWDADETKTKLNPYEEPVNETTLADVRLDLAREEAKLASQGQVTLHEMTASTFLSVGLELQEQQRALRKKDGHNENDISTKKATLQDKRNSLQHRIKAWRKVQAVYMPIVSTLISADSTPSDQSSYDTPKPEFEKLWMPFEVPAALRESGLAVGLAAKEARLREAEAEDALHQVRRMIRIRLGLRHYKSVNVDGPSQKRHSRARTIIKKFTERRDRQYERYNDARHALDLLDSNSDAPWRSRLRVLKKLDLVDPMGDDDDDDNSKKKKKKKKTSKQTVGEGRKEVPWIWRVLSHDARDHPDGEDRELSTEEIHDGMRVTYARSRARVRRWREEIEFVQEEMRRTVDTLQKRAAKWMRRLVDGRESASPDILSGLQGYAMRQHLLHEGLAASFKSLWLPLLVKYDMTINWPASPTVLHAPSLHSSSLDLPSLDLSSLNLSIYGESSATAPAEVAPQSLDLHRFKQFRVAAGLSTRIEEEFSSEDSDDNEHEAEDLNGSGSENEGSN